MNILWVFIFFWVKTCFETNSVHLIFLQIRRKKNVNSGIINYTRHAVKNSQWGQWWRRKKKACEKDNEIKYEAIQSENLKYQIKKMGKKKEEDIASTEKKLKRHKDKGKRRPQNFTNTRGIRKTYMALITLRFFFSRTFWWQKIELNELIICIFFWNMHLG